MLECASTAIAEMLSSQGRQDGHTCRDAGGAIPFTLDRRGTDREEAAKAEMWANMLNAVGVPEDMRAQNDTWVLDFATNIAGHGHSAPALSMHTHGCVTKVHQNLMPVLHLLLKGTKHWFLWRPHAFTYSTGQPQLSDQAYRREGLSGSSALATQEAHELIKVGKRYRCHHVVQTAGTMLYLPAGWYHFVVSTGASDASTLEEAFCVSVVSWLGTPSVRVACYLLAVDDGVWEDQTPPDNLEATTYPRRPFKKKREGVRTLRISKEAACRRHNEAVMQHCRSVLWPAE